METINVEVKSKGESLGTFPYEQPIDLNEALDVDGEEKIFQLFARQRKINFLNNKRRELTGGGLPKALVDALKSMDPAALKAIADQAGVEL